MVSQADSPTNTRDTLWGGELVFWQPARGTGYRFNLDPVLLAGFVRPSGHVLDLGSGCGIIGILLVAQGKAESVTGVEIQAQLAELARLNATENAMGERVHTRRGDLREAELPAVDAVVFNPPYFRVGEGRSAPDPGREAARRERHGTLEDFVRRGFSALEYGSSLYCIVRTDRVEELATHVSGHGGGLVRVRAICPREGAEPRHLLVEAVKGGVSCCQQEPPLVVHDGKGYGQEVSALLRQ